MIRITNAEERSRTIITVDGQLTGDCTASVETSCNQAVAIGKPVVLFLRDIQAVDNAGRMLLSRLAARGIRLAGTGVYISYLVEALSPTTVTDHDSPIETVGGTGKDGTENPTTAGHEDGRGALCRAAGRDREAALIPGRSKR